MTSDETEARSSLESDAEGDVESLKGLIKTGDEAGKMNLAAVPCGWSRRNERRRLQ